MKEKLQIKTLKLVMSKDKYDIILKAIKKVKKQVHPQEISDSRALEFIAMEYINSI